jgi:hypothetical protein
VVNVCVNTDFAPALERRSRSVTALAAEVFASPGTRSCRSRTRTTEIERSFTPTGERISQATYSSDLATA